MCSRAFDLPVFPSMSRVARRLHSLAASLAALPSISPIPRARLKLARFPTRSALPCAPLPSISPIPRLDCGPATDAKQRPGFSSPLPVKAIPHKTKAPCRVLPAGRFELIRLDEPASVLWIRQHSGGITGTDRCSINVRRRSSFEAELCLKRDNVRPRRVRV
jgi:hypothetical protein